MFARFNNSVSLRKFSAALVAVTALVMTGCGDVYVHEEFDKLTMNKSDAEVTTAIGKPTAVDANDPKQNSSTWQHEYSLLLDQLQPKLHLGFEQYAALALRMLQRDLRPE